MFKQTGSAGGHLNPTSPMSLNTGQAKRAVKMLMYGVQEFGVRFHVARKPLRAAAALMTNASAVSLVPVEEGHGLPVAMATW